MIYLRELLGNNHIQKFDNQLVMIKELFFKIFSVQMSRGEIRNYVDYCFVRALFPKKLCIMATYISSFTFPFAFCTLL